MIRLTFYTIILACCISACAAHQAKKSHVSSDLMQYSHPDSLAFTLTDHNNLLVTAMLNQVDSLQLMLHTAASDVSITEDAAAKISKSLTSESTAAKAWGGDGEIKYSINNLLSIGQSKWDSLTVWINKNSGPGSDGKFGPGLYENKFIEINHDIQMLIIHDKLPQTSDAFEKFILEMDDHNMLITGQMGITDQALENQFLIHSGFGGTILIDDAFASAHRLSDQLKITDESQLKDSFGNVLKTNKAVLPSFAIGPYKFDDLPMSFFEGKIGPLSRSVLGGALLKRFNIIIAMHEGHIYLQPNELYDTPFIESWCPLATVR